MHRQRVFTSHFRRAASHASRLICGAAIVIAGLPSLTCGQDLGAALTTLQQATSGPDVDATAIASAWRKVAQTKTGDLPLLLAAFDNATPVGVNWLSSAMDAALESETRNGSQISIDQLNAYVLDSTKGSLGRETALELLATQDADAATQTIDQLLTDPVARMRRPAVAAAIQRARDATDDDVKLKRFNDVLEFAVDEDHVIACAVALRELGQPIDHVQKFGFLMHWQIIGPFDYKDGEGFDTAYPPESTTLDNYDSSEGIFSEHEFDGKDGAVKWTSFVNSARNGEVNLNKAIAELRDAVAYGAMVFESTSEQDVELRLRQQNSAKLWLNGELVFTQSIGHTGNFFDQYTVPVTLKKGPNLIIVKSCQVAGEAEHPFLKSWQFGVRVCDSTGNAILAEGRPPTPELDPRPGEKPKQPDSDSGDTESGSESDDDKKDEDKTDAAQTSSESKGGL